MPVAASAIVAMYAWNGLPHLFKGNVSVKQVLDGIESCGICGSRAPKFIVDSSFIVGMAESFLADYPWFDADWFDPWRRDGAACRVDDKRSVGGCEERSDKLGP